MNLLTGILSVAGCAWMSTLLLRTWIDPMAVDGGRWVALGVGIMVMEFIMVHSGAMIAGVGMTGRSPRMLLGVLVALYSLFGLAISFAFDSRLLLWTFVAIMVPRVLGAASGTPEARQQAMMRSLVSAMLYLCVAFLSVLVPFPDGGLSTSVLDQVYPDRGGGEWEREPQRALAAGAIYFGVLGLFELAMLRRGATRTLAPALLGDPVEPPG